MSDTDDQVRSQTMSTVGVAASSAGVYALYNAISNIYCVYILCMRQRKQCLCQDHNINTNYTMRATTLHKTSCMYLHF